MTCPTEQCSTISIMTSNRFPPSRATCLSLARPASDSLAYVFLNVLFLSMTFRFSVSSDLVTSMSNSSANIAVASEADISANVSGLSEIISNLTDVGYASNTWIDNVSYKGFSGSYTVKKLDALVPGAVDGNVIKVSAWVSEEGVLRRVRLEGALTSDDSASAIRTFDSTK